METHSAGRLRKNLIHPQFRSKVVLVQEGTELLPYCDLCRMHILAGRLIKQRCKKRYVKIAARCLEATFSLIGEEEA